MDLEKWIKRILKKTKPRKLPSGYYDAEHDILTIYIKDQAYYADPIVKFVDKIWQGAHIELFRDMDTEEIVGFSIWGVKELAKKTEFTDLPNLLEDKVDRKKRKPKKRN